MSRTDETASTVRFDSAIVGNDDATNWRDAIPDDRIAHVVKETFRAFQRSLYVRFVDQSVSMGHWVFLRILWEHDGLTQGELSRRAGLMVPTTFVALRAMEKAGYVQRVKKKGNRKSVYVHLTPLGWKLKDVLVPLAIETNDIATRGLTADDLAALRRCLTRMLENLTADDRQWTEQRGISRQDGEPAGGKRTRRADAEAMLLPDSRSP